MRLSAIVGETDLADSISLKGIDLIFSGLWIFNSPFSTEIDNGIYNKAVRQRMISAPTTMYLVKGSFAKYNDADSTISPVAVIIVPQVLSITFFFMRLSFLP